MEPCKVIISPSTMCTRVLVMQGPDEILRAVLPPPSGVHSWAALRLLEGLALWLDRKLSVVLSVSDPQARSCLGLTDDMGVARHQSLFFRVDVQERGRRRRGTRIRGVGDFADLRQLHLVLDGEVP